MATRDPRVDEYIEKSAGFARPCLYGIESATPNTFGVNRAEQLLLRRFRGNRVDDGTHFGNSIRGKTALLRVDPNHLFVGRNVNAINLIVRHVTFNPLNLRPEIAQHRARFLGSLEAAPATFSRRQGFLFRSQTWA